jgi:hypothetical protein
MLCDQRPTTVIMPVMFPVSVSPGAGWVPPAMSRNVVHGLNVET